MALREFGIEHKRIEEQLIAYIQCTIKERSELQPIYKRLIQQCKEFVNGPAFGLYYWLTGEDMDVKACVPITHPIETNEIKYGTLEGADVLSFIYKGTFDQERFDEYITKVSHYLRSRGIPFGERRREIYLDSNNPEGNEIEYQVAIHNWTDLLATNMEQVLGKKISQEAMEGIDEPTLETSHDGRVQWIKTVLERLEEITDEDQKYDIISRCAHVFPEEIIQRLRDNYEKTKSQTNDPLKAVDEVLTTIKKDQLWFPKPYRFRQGKIIYSERCPGSPKEYEEATTEAEKRKAHCYCTVIRNYLEEGIIPHSFCNCSAGWERQIWEGILKKPVKVDVVKSIVKGDNTCLFAIHIPDSL